MKCSFLVIFAIGAFAHVEAFYYRREIEDAETIKPIDGDLERRPEPPKDYVNKKPEEKILQRIAEAANVEIVTKLAKYFDMFRKIVKSGNEDFPVMDPLVLPSVGPITSVRYKEPVEVILHNVKIEGLRHFIIEEIILNTNDSVLFCQVRIPWLYITGSYECSASKPPMTQTQEPLVTTGNFKSMIFNLEIRVQINLGQLPVGNMQRVVLDISAVNSTFLLSDVKGSKNLHHVVEEYLKNGAKNNFHDLFLELDDLIVEQVAPIINDVLRQLTIEYSPPV